MQFRLILGLLFIWYVFPESVAGHHIDFHQNRAKNLFEMKREMELDEKVNVFLQKLILKKLQVNNQKKIWQFEEIRKLIRRGLI